MLNTNLWFSIWRVGIALVIGFISLFLLHFLLRSVEKRLIKSGESGERKKRLTTLVHAGNSIGNVAIFLIVVLMILHELGINITPVLASAGVIGLAFSLGSQTIIKDFLAGVIILSENQYKIGDIITIGQMTGTVEHISLRATYLRDNEGKLILVPNGDIRNISNLTTHWAQVIITLNFDYETDVNQVLVSLEHAIEIAKNKKDLASELVGDPSTFGWTGFTDWAAQAQIIARTRSGKQWFVARELRKIILSQLSREGIKIATPLQRIDINSKEPK
jgi:small-conductance mechanosensitive channel